MPIIAGPTPSVISVRSVVVCAPGGAPALLKRRLVTGRAPHASSKTLILTRSLIPNPGVLSLNALCLNLTPHRLSFKERRIEGRGL